ncbi:AGAP006271-PA-like protein [Anopheles sinensis]|uniref:AGAP006271-PA-like protein n=1 Tax=Anopheles sinensis TaxID=74873 RepID=A0A084WKF9_ANOSI|nr:AGAP006271-PA-like protein [Anopheles sinensis]
MSAVPVVWCSDPNSSDKKQPFALQGIQLQGNITEKHVLAMKELINAASEGRLLLPTDGAIVLLDCGLSIGSMVIEGKAGKEVAAANAASNNKSIPANGCPALARSNHCDPTTAETEASPSAALQPIDEGGDCNNHNSSGSNSDESDRIANSSRRGRVIAAAGGGSDSRQQRIEAADRLRTMLERQLVGADERRDIDPGEANPTVHHQDGAEAGANEEADEEIDFPTEVETEVVAPVEDEPSEHRRAEEGLAVGRVTNTAGPELLYEFLCCAKCMNDPSSSCSNLPSNRSRSLTALNNSSKLLSRVLNGRAKARLYCDPVYSISNLYFKRFINYKITKSRTEHASRRPVVRKGSGRSERSVGGEGGAQADTGKKKHFVDGAPIYATVNKKLKLKSRLDALRRSGNMLEGACTSGGGPAMLSSTGRRIRHGMESAHTLRARRLANVKALVEQQQQLQLLASQTSELGHQSPEPSPPDILVTPPGTGKPYNSTSRKTSFDSTCTVSSMDSGFIDQQQRQQLKQQQLLLRQSGVEGPEGSVKVLVDTQPTEEEEKEGDGADQLNDLSRLQIKECLVTQSRNRRKSYEEFKSLFRQELVAGSSGAPLEVDGGHAGRSPPLARGSINTAGLPLPSVDEKESVKARRKSYEEFKALVKICDTSFSSLKSTAEEPEPRQEEQQGGLEDSRTRRSATLPASTSPSSSSTVGNLFKMKRKNSRRLSLKKLKPSGGAGLLRSESGPPGAGPDETVVKGSTIYDILRSDRKHSSPAAIPLIKDLGSLGLTKEEIYRKNYKIYDKLLSYGSKAYKRYDKYMTYGTIYEILHRKSDAAEDVFLRKRALSEKFAKRKHAGGGAGTSPPSHYGSLKLGTIYDILQGKHHQLSAIDPGCRKTTNGAVVTTVGGGGDVEGTPPATLSTIYDIIHSKKSAESSPKQIAKNRFLVKKITEEELQLSNENDRNKSNLVSGTGLSEVAGSSPKSVECGGPPSPDYTTPKSVGNSRKPARTRRFSNILSYTASPKSTSATASTTIAATPAQAPAHESRLGSPRLKQIAASDEDLYKSATAKLKAAQQQVERHQLSVDELYARIGKLRKSATVSSALCDKIDEVAAEHTGDELLSLHKHKHHHHQLHHQQLRHFLEIPHQRDGATNNLLLHEDDGLRMVAPVVTEAAPVAATAAVPEPGPIFKSNSLDMLAPKKLSRTARWSKQMQDAATGWSGPIRKLSPLIMPNKGGSQQKKSTRRLSEFTRGEFLNEKP